MTPVLARDAAPGQCRLADSHEIVHGVSDEHRRQVDYVEGAGQSAGFEVKREVALATRVRSDAVIFGSQVQMGVEVQRSGLTATAAKARATRPATPASSRCGSRTQVRTRDGLVMSPGSA